MHGSPSTCFLIQQSNVYTALSDFQKIKNKRERYSRVPRLSDTYYSINNINNLKMTDFRLEFACKIRHTRVSRGVKFSPVNSRYTDFRSLYCLLVLCNTG